MLYWVSQKFCENFLFDYFQKIPSEMNSTPFFLEVAGQLKNLYNIICLFQFFISERWSFHIKEHFGLINSIIALHRKSNLVQSGCITFSHILQFHCLYCKYSFCHIIAAWVRFVLPL